MRHFVVLMLFVICHRAFADVSVKDDTGAVLHFKQPVARIVALAPHIAETLLAAGARARLVGTVQFSDYPEAAKRVPRVGSYVQLDMEAIVALKPDLVVAWQTGNSPAHIEKIRQLGIPVYVTQPNTIDDVAHDLERYGELMGTQEGLHAAEMFRARLETLRKAYSKRAKIRVFYQVWKAPLMTVGANQIIGDVIRICGGENVFGNLGQMAPTVSVEAVLATKPEAIVASGMDEARPEWLDDWRHWPQIVAVAADNLYFIPPDIIQRHTPRLLDGAELMCKHLETARTHLNRK